MYNNYSIIKEIMSRKDKNEIAQNGNSQSAKQTINFNQTVSEGTKVILDTYNFIKDINDTNNSYSYSWKQTEGIPVVFDNTIENTHSFSFTAPYLEGHDVNHTLRFKLTITDNNSGKTIIPNSNLNVIVKRVHRAIIFQGGVSLGAYEAGVFQALVEKLSEEDKTKKESKSDGRPLFDIVAGTSIGSMNAAIVVSSIIKDKTWKDASRELIKFWKNQEYQFPTLADSLDANPLYHYWWDMGHITNKILKRSFSNLTVMYSNINFNFKKWYGEFWTNYFLLDIDFWKDYFINGWYIPATAESARKYYSAKQFHKFGAPNVASGIQPWSIFGKFFDLEELNFNPRPDNKHLPGYSLKKTLQNFVDFPIKTNETQPRFILVTVDVHTGDAVTFDSYKKNVKDVEGNILKDENGNNITRHYSEYGSNEQNKHVISYDKGIEIEHVLASGTFPAFFDYPSFKVENNDMNIKNDEHIFWDGGFRSNTPLREVIQVHRDYWHKEGSGDENDVPDLEVYIADLWPSVLKEDPISFDNDFVENRKLNIIFSDKTHYDEQVANVVTDYIDLAKELKNLAERSGVSKDEINQVLDKYASSKNRKGRIRAYHDLLGGRFRLTKVVRIDHKDDGNEVANKIYDYSYTTIENLMKEGYCDTLTEIGLQLIKDGITEIANKKSKGKYDNHIQVLEKILQQIQKSVKIENGYGATINQVQNFIKEVKSIKEIENRSSLKEEKILLIDAAKQFEKIINETKDQNVLLYKSN